MEKIELQVPHQLLREKNAALLECARIMEKIVESINHNQIVVTIKANNVTASNGPAVEFSSGDFETLNLKAKTIASNTKKKGQP